MASPTAARKTSGAPPGAGGGEKNAGGASDIEKSSAVQIHECRQSIKEQISEVGGIGDLLL